MLAPFSAIRKETAPAPAPDGQCGFVTGRAAAATSPRTGAVPFWQRQPKAAREVRAFCGVVLLSQPYVHRARFAAVRLLRQWFALCHTLGHVVGVEQIDHLARKRS